MKIKITFIEPVLGTWPSNEELARDYVASLAPDANTREEEIATIGIEKYIDKGKTAFVRDPEGRTSFYDYQIKGFFKDACACLARGKKLSDGKPALSAKLKAFKKTIDGNIFPSPRFIPIKVNGKIGSCQRPLRAQTAQGERVSLANSEEIPAGSTIEFEITTFGDDLEPLILEWFDYGKFRGLGQWRNSGKGRFRYEVLEM